MNRVKLWVFTLLVVALGFLLVRSAASARREDVVAALDARLASAAAHVAGAIAASGREATALGALVARDEAMHAALRAPPPAPLPAPPAAPPPVKGKGKAKKSAPPPPPPPAPAPDPAAQDAKIKDASHAALGRAASALGLASTDGVVVAGASRESLARRPETPADAELVGLLRAAVNGQPRRGVVRQAGALFYGVAQPAGEGHGLAILVPLDDAWARRISTAAGVDVALTGPELKPFTTAKGVEPGAFASATKLAGAGDVGRPGEVDISVGPVKLPRLPQPFAGGAPIRARAVPIEGVKGAFAILSIPAAAAVNAPAVFHWRAVAGLAVVLLVGLILGLFIRSTEPTPQVPEKLLSAAARIEKGDFAARAPQLAGKLGTLAAALNRAAEIAGPAAAARGPTPTPMPAAADDWFQGPAVRAAADRQGQPAMPIAAVPGPPPLRAPPAVIVPPPVPAMPPAALEVDEESHWQQTFQDFLKTRASCGEGSDGLTYDKFRVKLEGNKAQLVAKYGCKSVRFQVYVKDGKAALKATPVK